MLGFPDEVIEGIDTLLHDTNDWITIKSLGKYLPEGYWLGIVHPTELVITAGQLGTIMDNIPEKAVMVHRGIGPMSMRIHNWCLSNKTSEFILQGTNKNLLDMSDGILVLGNWGAFRRFGTLAEDQGKDVFLWPRRKE